MYVSFELLLSQLLNRPRKNGRTFKKLRSVFGYVFRQKNYAGPVYNHLIALMSIEISHVTICYWLWHPVA